MHGGLENTGYIGFFEALVDGRLKLGQTITQVELCDVLGLTLSRMRDVAVLLEAEGMIKVQKRRGVTIFYPDVNFVGGTFQFREVLETEGLRRFVEMVTNEWIDRTTRAHETMIEFVRTNNDARIYATPVRLLENDFHHSFIHAFGNDQILINYRRNSQKTYLLRLLNPDAVGPGNTIKSLSEHVRVVEALRDRNEAEAVDALQRHIRSVLHRVLTH
ncbi:GntR family transcriptional regulator [Devosia algicola]|uniref:GntR family transcriptional regulator n=1 Tax=Devosia algicola TaxID=3026418 RepID=A0ABY7YJ52_9HYPH|nr:GntR family transcriptional regulator [Devosia algicola]WDR01282.1 GntR family transcriptional regulator [Devosia algicola]